MFVSRHIFRLATRIVFLVALAAPGSALSVVRVIPQPELQRGFLEMYNLDFNGVHQTFGVYQELNPDDPLGPIADAAAYLFSEFNRLHILESDLFINDEVFDHREVQQPDPAVKAAFEAALAQGDALTDKALAATPNNANALFARVLSNGLRSDYAAMIEKRNLASLSYMRTSRTTAQKLLAIDPNCYDAYLAIGIENYLLGSESAPVRWLLRAVGSQTDKEAGIVRLQLTAQKGYYLAPFARLLLAVAALRNKDSETARILLAGLATEFPRNQLYSRELARIQ
ncbi:MAG TPA: hypothetical protein VMT56_00985 [Candidatus Bathyarchaeia archaeon]|nr:hypothetical protein [Candidatus Bathyarchaeia archaeon]